MNYLKIFIYYVIYKSLERIFTADYRDDLCWRLAYNFEKLPKRWALDLKDYLGLRTEERRKKLFFYWLNERGLSEQDFNRHCYGQSRGLAVYGFLKSESGLGQAARAYADAFETSKLPMSCHILSHSDSENKVEFNAERNFENHVNTALLALNADQIKNISYWMDPSFVRRNYRAGLVFWELPVFPAIWSQGLAHLDEVWVASDFVAQSLKSATTLPIRVLPVPVSLNDRVQVDCRNKLQLPLDRLICLVNFDFNSYPERKNPLASLRAFSDAFPHQTSASPLLIVKCHGILNRGKYEQELARSIKENKNIIWIDRNFTSDDMLNLHAAADVYLSLHRSEGYGLNLAESMAAGKVVVGTNFSGNLAFMNSSNSILIDYKMKKLEAEDYVAASGQWWAEPSHDHAVSALREIAENTRLRSEIGAKAYGSIKENLSHARIGAQMSQYVI